MSEEIISQKEKFLQEVEQELLRKELDTELLRDRQAAQNSGADCSADKGISSDAGTDTHVKSCRLR